MFLGQGWTPPTPDAGIWGCPARRLQENLCGQTCPEMGNGSESREDKPFANERTATILRHLWLVA